MRVSVLLALLTIAATSLEGSTWLNLRSSRFEIATDAGEAAARQLVIDLEQFDGAIAQASTSFGPATGPLRIFLFRNESEFSGFRNDAAIAGLTLVPGNRTAPIVLLYAGAKLRENAIHEYIHAMVARGDWKLPRWFEEGLAELYGHSERIGRDRFSIGGRIPEYLGQLKNQPINSSIFKNRSNRELYYSASWAMVHMLLMEPRYHSTVERLLEDSSSWEPAFPELLRGLRQYLARPAWKTATVIAPQPAQPELTVTTVAGLESEFMLAALLLDAGRPEAARQRYKRIAAAHPLDSAGVDSAGVDSARAEAAGFSALASGQTDVARAEFRRAVELQTIRARVWSELASLDREAGAPWATVKPMLERAASLDPTEYRSAFILGIHETDDGEFQQAILHLANAAKAAPAQPDVWHAYAIALSKAGRLDEARSAAKRALRGASSPEWERMAADLVASLESRQARSGPATRKQPEVVTSPAWNRPSPDAEVDGRFVEFVCAPDPPRLKVELEGGRVIELVVRDPTRVTILNPDSGEPSMELKCGPQDRRPIHVGFRRADSTVLEVKFPQVHDLKRF